METSGDDGAAVPLDVPGMGTSFDYFVDCTVEGGKFVPWRNVVPSFKYQKDTAYTAILVNRPDLRKSREHVWLCKKGFYGHRAMDDRYDGWTLYKA